MKISNALNDYFAALERLKLRKAKINNDTVSLEAGRKKGSIKKSRPKFAALISDIEAANANANVTKDETTEKLARSKDNTKVLRTRLDAALVRELSLLKEVFELKKELAKLRGGNVIPIYGPSDGGIGNT